MAISVVATEIAIMTRTRETKRAAAGSRGWSVASLMAGHIETVAVAAAQSGERLDRVLAAHFAGESPDDAVALSRTRLKALILAREGAIGGATHPPTPRPRPARGRTPVEPPAPR